MIIKDNIQRVNIDKLFPNTWNPNKQSDFIFEKEINSIRKFGMIDPITVREIPEGFEIIDGEHRYRACKQLQMTEVPVNNLGAVSDAVAKQLTMITNETRGKAERTDLAELIRELSQSVTIDELSENLPFTNQEMASFLSAGAIDWSDLETEVADVQMPKEDDEAWRNVSYRLPEGVAEQLEQQVTRFKKALHPIEDVKDVSPVMAIEAMIQHLAQIPDDEII